LSPQPLSSLSVDQRSLSVLSLQGSIFLEGAAGSGKTTGAISRMISLAAEKSNRESILILVPQRSLAAAYYHAINSPDFPDGALPTILTIGGLAMRMVDLFWPLIAGTAGFHGIQTQPKFLTLETAQYFMAKIVNPMIAAGDFQGLSLEPNRLFSQILDNLNKAAIVGFPFEQIGERLSAAWMGDPGQSHIFSSAQIAATRFREFCLENNLLDFSLQIDTFVKHLWVSPLVRNYLISRFSHLIFDNVEEDAPVTHDLIQQWLPEFESALLIYNHGGGYRTFLGADPASGFALREYCKTRMEFSEVFQSSPEVQKLSSALSRIIRQENQPHIYSLNRRCFEICQSRFVTEMISQVGEKIDRLVHLENIPPGEIVVISPFMSDALLFSLQRKLSDMGIPNRSSRPSRSLGNEPAVRTLLTLAKMAYSAWQMSISPFAMRAAFAQSFMDGDLNRADLLVKIVAPHYKRTGQLVNFETILPETQSRITYLFGERYQSFRGWLDEFIPQQDIELDIFLSRIFGEVLSQRGYGFHEDNGAAYLTEQLIVSVQKFRRLHAGKDHLTVGEIGKEYIQMLETGVLAAQYFSPTDEKTEDSVLLSPAYSFLMSDRAVRFQFWLDAGSHGWWERLFQPLTQPYVLSSNWQPDRKWTDADEIAVNQETMTRLVQGLLDRCTEKVTFSLTGLNESGVEEKGRLLQALFSLTKRLSPQEENHV